MPDEEKLSDKFKKANDGYHEAVDEILEDENLPVETKAQFATYQHQIFGLMKKASAVLHSY